MKIGHGRRWCLPALAASVPLLLAGCSGLFKSNAPLSQVYVLRPTWPAAGVPGAAATEPGTVEVMLPQAVPGLAGDTIVVLRSGERLDHYRGARWPAAAPGMLQALAIEALRTAHRFAIVESDAGPFAPDYVLSLELTHFEAEYTGAGAPTVHVALVCSLGRRGSRDVIASFSADSRVTAAADRMQSVVAAFERATGEALSQLAAGVPAPPGTPP
jgi:cholesterol transport system auxiliary component